MSKLTCSVAPSNARCPMHVLMRNGHSFNDAILEGPIMSVAMPNGHLYSFDLNNSSRLLTSSVSEFNREFNLDLTDAEHSQIKEKFACLSICLRGNRLFLDNDINSINDARTYVVNDGMFEALHEDYFEEACERIFRTKLTLEAVLILNTNWAKGE